LYSDQLFREVERVLRVTIQGNEGREKLRALEILAREHSEFCLDLIDFLLYRTASHQAAAGLEVILLQGGSAWRVVEREDSYGLERRVATAVAEAVDAVTNPRDRAAVHLSRAWSAQFGRDPDPSTAYREAVRAVEAIGKPIISPRNDRATLGTMIADLRAAPHKWRLALGAPAGFDPIQTLIAMMELLWKGQLDRHGTDDESVPLNVLPDEAEVALLVAIPLVHWFRQGLVMLEAE
jgi:hypothetical protein